MARWRKCWDCPKNNFGWCTIRAELHPPDSPACGYMPKFMRELRKARKAESKKQQERGRKHD